MSRNPRRLRDSGLCAVRKKTPVVPLPYHLNTVASGRAISRPIPRTLAPRRSLKPTRCQRIRVCGRTTTPAVRHANSREQRQAYPRRAIDPPRLQGPLHVQGQLPAQESNLCIQRLA